MRNFFRKNIKTIITVIITAVVCVSGTSIATYLYNASEIKYNEQMSVEDALDDLYNKKKNGIFVAFFNNRLYTTTYQNVYVHDYNTEIVESVSDDNVITIKEDGKYRLHFISYYGFHGFNLYSNYKINSNTVTLPSAELGHVGISESVEFELKKGDTFLIESKMSAEIASVGTVAAVLYKI